MIKRNKMNFFPEYVESIPEQYTIPVLSDKISMNIENELYYSEVAKNIRLYRKNNRIAFVKNLYRLSIGDAKQMLQEFINRKFK